MHLVQIKQHLGQKQHNVIKMPHNINQKEAAADCTKLHHNLFPKIPRIGAMIHMFNMFKKAEKKNPTQSGAKVIQMENVPLTDSGEPDIVAVLAANGLSGIDMSKVKVMSGSGADKNKILEAINKMS